MNAVIRTLLITVLLLCLYWQVALGQAPDTLAASPALQATAGQHLDLWTSAASSVNFCNGNPRCVYTDSFVAVRVLKTIKGGTTDVYIEFTLSGLDTYYRYVRLGPDNQQIGIPETVLTQPPVSWNLLSVLSARHIFQDLWTAFD